MDKNKFEFYKSAIYNEKNNISKNIFILEEQILDLKSKLEYKNLMFKLIENIFNILYEKDIDESTVVIPLKLKDYFNGVFTNKEDIYTFLHSNLFESGISNFIIESYHQFKIKNYMNENLNKYFDTYLSISL